PLIAQVFAESLRLLRRASHAEVMMAEDRSDLEAFQWQMSRLAALQPALQEYLEEAPKKLSGTLATAPEADQRDILCALDDLHAGAPSILSPLLANPRSPHAEWAVNVLAWSRAPQVAPWLRDWARQRIPLARRAQGQRRSAPPRRRSIPADFPY